jgi:hypothetical protein
MKALLKTSVLCIAVITGVGCTGSQNRKPLSIDVASLSKTNESPEEKAEALALAGEQLMVGGAFMYADRTLDVALAIDKDNARANFYKKLVAPAMRMKGIFTRVRPLLTETARQQLDDGLKQSPNGALKSFLTEGSEDLRSEREVQALMDGFIQDLNSLRLFLKTTKSQELVLNLPSEYQSGRMQEIYNHCQWSEPSPQVYESTCDLSDAFTFSMNRADKEALQQMISGYQVYLSIANAYSLDGMIALSKIDDATKTPSFVQNYLKSNPHWGVLRHSELLSSIVTMGNDAVTGVRWAQANQKSLCPAGEEKYRSRKGNLFEQGICIANTEKTTQILAMASQVLAGGIVKMPTSNSNETVDVRPAQILAAPIRDLKAQLPVVTDECGRLVSMPDRTIGGLLPNGDAQKLFPSNCGAAQ